MVIAILRSLERNTYWACAMAAVNAVAVLLLIIFPGFVSSEPHTEELDKGICADHGHNNTELLWELDSDSGFCESDVVKNFKEKSNNLPDKAAVLSFLQLHCMEGITKETACLADALIGCHATIQEKINQAAASGMGFLCQPDGTGLEPAWSAAFDSINDEDFTQFHSNSLECQDDPDSCRGYHPFSRYIVWNSSSVDISLHKTVTNIQREAEGYIRCKAGVYKAMKDRCSLWRVGLLRTVIEQTFRPELGLRMPFSMKEVAEMFEFSTASATRTSYISVPAVMIAWLIAAICVADKFHL